MKEQLGHYSIQITVDTYGHLIPGANRKAVNALDDPGRSDDLLQPPDLIEQSPEGHGLDPFSQSERVLPGVDHALPPLLQARHGLRRQGGLLPEQSPKTSFQRP